MRSSIIFKTVQWDQKVWGTIALGYKSSRSETAESQGILSSALLDTAKLFPNMVIPVYTPINSSLYILNISPLSIICVLNTFLNLLFPIFLMTKSSSTVVKFINLFLDGQYFLYLVLWNLSVFLILYSPIYSSKHFMAVHFTVRFMALYANQLLFRISMGFCRKEFYYSSLHFRMSRSGVTLLYCC